MTQTLDATQEEIQKRIIHACAKQLAEKKLKDINANENYALIDGRKYQFSINYINICPDNDNEKITLVAQKWLKIINDKNYYCTNNPHIININDEILAEVHIEEYQWDIYGAYEAWIKQNRSWKDESNEFYQPLCIPIIFKARKDKISRINNSFINNQANEIDSYYNCDEWHDKHQEELEMIYEADDFLKNVLHDMEVDFEAIEKEAEELGITSLQLFEEIQKEEQNLYK